VENWEVSACLEKIAQLLALKGENEYKIRSYQQAARTISHLEVEVRDLVNQKQLSELKGIGKALSSKIEAMVKEGQSSYLKELQKSVPSQLLALFSIPGVGIKTVSLLVTHLQPSSLEQVEEAARTGCVRHVPGLGAAMENRIREGLEGKEDLRGIFHQGIALPVAESLLQELRHAGKIKRGALSGALRRGVDAVSEAVLVVETTESTPEIASFLSGLNFTVEVSPVNEEKISVETDFGVPVVIYLVGAGLFFLEWWYRTGSSRHVSQVEDLALSQGKNIYEPGYCFGKEGGCINTEEEIYNSLGIDYVYPELREGNGEVKAAQQMNFPPLVKREDIQGDLHLHSDWSDGNSTVEELAREAASLGYRYIAITDHSISLKIAGGLSPKEVLEQIDQVQALNNSFKELEILTGIEVDILSDGKLDLPDEVLSRLDLVIASIHSGFRQGEAQVTARLEAAAAHPLVNIIGHPTGRLIGKRESYPVDLVKIFKIAAENNTVLEINSAPDRLDLSDENLCIARRWGVKFAVGTDAHSTRSLSDINFGVTAARRAWLTPEDIINTSSLEELRKILKK